MDYEKNKEALVIVKQMVADKQISQEVAEKYFPELKESEDDKNKRILHSIASKMSFHLRDIFTEEEFQCFDAWSYAWLDKQSEQKSAEWSEDDREYMESLLDIINGTPSLTPSEVECHKDWLKSLKDRVQPQSHWKPSDEQMQTLYRYTEQNSYDGAVLTSLYNDIKKLK